MIPLYNKGTPGKMVALYLLMLFNTSFKSRAFGTITNLAPIKGLERLQFLDVSNNQISDITPLAACKALQYIELTGNKVTDVSALGEEDEKIVSEQ